MTILLRGGWQVGCLRGIWALSLGGVASIWFFPTPPYLAIVGLCVAIGWCGLLPLRHYLRAIPWKKTLWAWTGLALYCAAAACEALDWPAVSNYPYRIGSHEVFHILVSAASICFFVFMMRHVVGHAAQPEATADTHRTPFTGRSGTCFYSSRSTSGRSQRVPAEVC